MNLYHYTSQDSAIKILEELTLKITPPNKLNDPFEILPSAYKNFTEEKITESYKEAYQIVIKDKYKEELQGNFQGTIENFIHEYDLGEEEKIEDLKDLIASRDFTKFQNNFSEVYGLISFSKNENNILMWSHYADQHQGIVIGFDFTKFEKNIFKVEYSNERVELTFGMDKQNVVFKKELINLIRRKAKDWEYEKEYRMFLKLEDLEQKGKDYFLRFHIDNIKMIIFGSKISEETKRKIIGIKSLSKVKFFESNLSKSKFELDISKYNEFIRE